MADSTDDLTADEIELLGHFMAHVVEAGWFELDGQMYLVTPQDGPAVFPATTDAFFARAEAVQGSKK